MATTQVIVIHGGTTFAEYSDYLKNLETKPVKIERLLYATTWKEKLQDNLGEDYQVLLPSMPNGSNAVYKEWKIWFERISEVATDNCILIGHSLGGIFLAKYLSENSFPRMIKKLILIAAPYDDESQEDLTDFKVTSISPLLAQQVKDIVFFSGSDDPVVPPSEINKYKQALPEARYVILTAPDHFMRPELPELIEIIKE